MQCHRSDVRAIAGNFRELSINVIAHPNCEVYVHDQKSRDHHDEHPEPPTLCERSHSLPTLNAACNCNKVTRLRHSAAVFGLTMGCYQELRSRWGFEWETQTSLKVLEMELSMCRAKVTGSMSAIEKRTSSASAWKLGLAFAWVVAG